MMEGLQMMQKEMHDQILALAKEYCDTYHNQIKNLNPVTGFRMLPGFMTTKSW